MGIVANQMLAEVIIKLKRKLQAKRKASKAPKKKA